RRSLFFPCSADHRRLHSFPTRRSSDLIQTVDWYAGGFVNFDTNIDSDDRNCLLCQSVFYQRFGGVYYNVAHWATYTYGIDPAGRSEEHTSELQSRSDLVCRLLLEKKKS